MTGVPVAVYCSALWSKDGPEGIKGQSTTVKTRAVAHQIAIHCDHATGQNGYVSAQTLCDLTGITKRDAIYKAVEVLITRGWLTKTKGNPFDSRGVTYALRLPHTPSNNTPKTGVYNEDIPPKRDRYTPKTGSIYPSNNTPKNGVYFEDDQKYTPKTGSIYPQNGIDIPPNEDTTNISNLGYGVGSELLGEPATTPTIENQPTCVRWEELDQMILERLVELYGDRATLNDAVTFVKRCREFRKVAPSAGTPNGVIAYFNSRRADFADRQAEGLSYPKTSRDFVKWCSDQQSFEIYERTFGQPVAEEEYHQQMVEKRMEHLERDKQEFDYTAKSTGPDPRILEMLDQFRAEFVGGEEE